MLNWPVNPLPVAQWRVSCDNYAWIWIELINDQIYQVCVLKHQKPRWFGKRPILKTRFAFSLQCRYFYGIEKNSSTLKFDIIVLPFLSFYNHSRSQASFLCDIKWWSICRRIIAYNVSTTSFIMGFLPPTTRFRFIPVIGISLTSAEFPTTGVSVLYLFPFFLVSFIW